MVFIRKPLGDLANNRVEWFAPIVLRMIHHQVDKDRDKKRKNRRPVPCLAAIYSAIPGGTAVYKLVAQDIETVKYVDQDAWCVTS